MKRVSPYFLICLCVLVFMLTVACSRDDYQARTEERGPIASLAEGNRRFHTTHPRRPSDNISVVRKIATGQHPNAAIICCSDSRVSPELVFDQGLGDLFVIRTAGNVIGPIEIGSVEYAVEHLDVKLVVVMGHERCGAIQAYLDGEHPPGHIKEIVDSIAAETEIQDLRKHQSQDRDMYVKANVIHGIRKLVVHSDIIRERLGSSQLHITGAVYSMDEGKVAFIK